MLTLEQLSNYLNKNHADYEIITHSTPIISTHDAAKYFNIEFAAPSLVVDTDKGLMLFIVSSQRGKIKFDELKGKMQLSKIKMADKSKIKQITGYEVGEIPLIGTELPCVFDNTLLKFHYIYGGSGSNLHTLKISPNDVKKLNKTIFTFE